MSKSFADAYTRIRWAKENLTQFERRAKAFFNRTEYELLVQPEPDGKTELHKFRFVQPLPAILTQRTVSVIENLRAALDLATVDIGRLAQVSDIDSMHFPFCKGVGDLKSRVEGTTRSLPDEIKALLSSFKPYQGGNDLLWAINELCNAAKHRVLLSIAPQGAINIPYMETSDSVHHGPIELLEGVHCCSENEVIFARTPRGIHWKYQLSAAFGVAFAEVAVVEGLPVYPTLRELHNTVKTIVELLEAKCKELGLL